MKASLTIDLTLNRLSLKLAKQYKRDSICLSQIKQRHECTYCLLRGKSYALNGLFRLNIDILNLT